MVVVSVVAVVAVVVVVVEVLVKAVAIIDMPLGVEASVDDALDDLDIIVVSAIVIALTFVLPVPYSVNVSSGVDFELFMDDASAGVTRAILTGFGIEALTDVLIDVLAAVAIGVLSDIVVGGSANMLINVRLIVLDAAGIGLGLVVSASCAVDVLSEAVVNIDIFIGMRLKLLLDVLARALVVSDFSIVVLVSVDAESVLTPAMTALEFAETLLFC